MNAPVAVPTVDSPYLTIEMLGAYLQHSPHTIRYWHKKKILPPPFKPRGKLLWHKDEIDRWMIERRDRTAAKAYHRVQSAQVPLMRRQA